MSKRDYLIKTFSKTNKKDYENYILTAIWHKLGCLDIKPVTQQYVKRTDTGYALIDLYFPQVHVGVEVDEAFHKKQVEADELRMDDIISSISEEEISDFRVFRIDATQTIEQINKDIDGVVHYIKQKADSLQLSWPTYEEELAQLMQKETLSIYDDISFQYIKDIANTIFNRNAKGYQRSYFRVRENLWIWCPKLSINVGGDLKSAAGGWINVLAEDWSYIDESNQDEEILQAREESFAETVKKGRERAVFAKFKDNLGVNRYRFIGVFKVIEDLQPENRRFIRFTRIRESLEIDK
ncbi:AbaSI family restriction endonuclease [Halalkalibacillus sediminis]|uniref:AbaSI family restriction endonuclease n=1 Tax=Halalkalibacillus sediminis TaxID=2018042 RepID=UPI00117BB210|nr:hypothetical protein [Halalkalibacillus sediminis]